MHLECKYISTIISPTTGILLTMSVALCVSAVVAKNPMDEMMRSLYYSQWRERVFDPAFRFYPPEDRKPDEDWPGGRAPPPLFPSKPHNSRAHLRSQSEKDFYHVDYD